MVKEKEAHYTGKDKTSPEMTASVSYFCTSAFSLVRRKSLKQRTKKTPAFFYKSTLHADFNLMSFPHVIRVHRVCVSACYQGVIGEVLRVQPVTGRKQLWRKLAAGQECRWRF